MIKIQAQYTLEDFKYAQKLHMKGKRGTLSGLQAYFAIMVALVLIMFGFSLVSTKGLDWVALLIPVALMVAVGIYFAVTQPRQIARFFQQQKELSAPMEFELSEEGFAIQHQYGGSRIPWKEFAKWKEDQEMILLYRSDLSFHLLPKRFLAGGDQLQYVHDRLRQNNVPDAAGIRSRNWIWQVVFFVLLFVAICALVYFNLQHSR